jgi:DNA repair exonuclease SbcCD ATPase subunit
MNIVESISLKDIIYFKDAHVDIAAHKFVVVKGLNRSSRNRNQNNGAGKSLLFSPLPNVCLGSPPIATKKRSKKDLLRSKSSCNTVTMTTHSGLHLKIEQYLDRYQITENGKQLDPHGVKVGENYVRQYFPLNEQEFYSTCYIQSLRQLEFQMGTPTDRMHYLSNLFRLESYDKIKSYFLVKLRAVKDDTTRHATLSSQLAAVDAKLKKLAWSQKDAQRVKELKAKADTLSEAATKKLKQTHARRTLLDGLRALKRIDAELEILRPKYKFDSGPAKQLKILKDELDAAQEIAKYQAHLRTYKRNVRSIQDQLDAIKLPTNVDHESVLKTLSKSRQDLESIEDQLATERRHKLRYDELEQAIATNSRDLRKLGYEEEITKKEGKRIQEALATCTVTLRLERLITEHDHEDSMRCPTCLSDIDLDNLRNAVAKAKKQKAKYEKIQQAYELQREGEELVAKLKSLNFKPKLYAELTENKRKLADRIAKLEEQRDLLVEHKRLTAVLNKIEQPKRPKVERQLDWEQNKIERAIELCETILKHIQARDGLIEAYPGLHGLRTQVEINRRIRETETEIKELEAEYQKANARFSKISEDINNLELRQKEYQVHTKNRIDILAEMDKLKTSIKSRKVLEKLVEAYSSKGLKLKAIKNLLSMLEAHFNVYSPSILNENIRFSLKADSNGVLVNADRGHGIISDVRLLSGAESDCFRLLFLLSLLPMMPSDRRVNFLILDEPDSHMDDISRERFLYDMLPQLREIVNNIYVLTPKPDGYTDAERWTVVLSTMMFMIRS